MPIPEFTSAQSSALTAAHNSALNRAVEWLRANRFAVFLADTDQAVSYRSADYQGRVAFVVGSERYGIATPWYEAGFGRIAIPMLGSADSLNVVSEPDWSLNW